MRLKELDQTGPDTKIVEYEKISQKRVFCCAIELGVGIVPGGRRSERGGKGTKVNGRGREGGSLLMGFDGRQSYERVATQSDPACCVLLRRRDDFRIN